MTDRSELLWRYLAENLEHSRHHENLRASTTNILMSIAGGSFALVAHDGALNFYDSPLLLFVSLLGLFGVLFCAKQEERASAHYARAMTLRDELDRVASTGFLELRERSDTAHRRRYGFLYRLQVNSLWLGMHCAMAVIALALCISAAMRT